MVSSAPFDTLSSAATSRRRRAASGATIRRGRVVHGQRLGRELGVPTANLSLEPTNRLAFGVYAVVARSAARSLRRRQLRRAADGHDAGPPLLEVHLFGLSGDLYGREMEVAFLARLREERKFASLDALKAQMALDSSPALGVSGALIWRIAANHLIRAPRTQSFAFSRSHDRRAVPGPDYSDTLYLPKTDFPMRAGLPQKEPKYSRPLGARHLYGQLRRAAAGRPKFVLHDGPPYANGNIHIGHALNKILKDLVVRSEQMAGKNSNYVPGWDCHGLPIEWKVEEENYRRKGKVKPDFSDAKAMVAFRRECRATADHWVSVQREEFKRLGVVGDWDHPYLTMTYPAEAQIAREIHKFAANGLLYRGSKPVMWSVVEKTALAEAEVEYEDTRATRSMSRFLSPRRRFGGDLDHNAVDNSRQSRDRLLATNCVRPLPRDGTAADNWAKAGATYILAQPLAERFLARESRLIEWLGEHRLRNVDLHRLRAPAASPRLRL